MLASVSRSVAYNSPLRTFLSCSGLSVVFPGSSRIFLSRVIWFIFRGRLHYSAREYRLVFLVSQEVSEYLRALLTHKL